MLLSVAISYSHIQIWREWEQNLFLDRNDTRNSHVVTLILPAFFTISLIIEKWEKEYSL